VESGYLYEEIVAPRIVFNRRPKILFLDTCLNKNSKSVATRKQALGDFYHFFSQKNQKEIDVYHKFHPGLLKKEKVETLKMLKTGGVRTITGCVDMKDYDLVLGFYSTLFHDALCCGTCYVELTGIYNLLPSFENSLDHSPIRKVKNKQDIGDLFVAITDNLDELYHDEIWEWYYRFYNIPNGKLALMRNLGLQ